MTDASGATSPARCRCGREPGWYGMNVTDLRSGETELLGRRLFGCGECEFYSRNPEGWNALMAPRAEPEARFPECARVETGCVKFDDDWRGVFIRGDDCAGFYAALNWPDALGHDRIRESLKSLLESSREHLKDVPVRHLSAAVDAARPAQPALSLTPEERERIVGVFESTMLRDWTSRTIDAVLAALAARDGGQKA